MKLYLILPCPVMASEFEALGSVFTMGIKLHNLLSGSYDAFFFILFFYFMGVKY